MLTDNRAGTPAFKLLFLPSWLKSYVHELNSFKYDAMQASLSQEDLLAAAFFLSGSPIESYYGANGLFDYWLTQSKFDNNYLYQLNNLKQHQRKKLTKPNVSTNAIVKLDVDVLRRDELFFVVWLDDSDMTSLTDKKNTQRLTDHLFSLMSSYFPLDILARTFNSVFPFFINELKAGDN